MTRLYAPNGTQYRIGLEYYKIGLRGMVFWWTGTQWIRSTTTRETLAKTANPIIEEQTA